MQQVITVPFSDQLIGQGYNSQTGESVGTALEVDSVFEDTSTDAQSASTDFEVVSTQDSLLETLGVSASADVRIGMFSAGAKMSFSEQHAVNSSSTYVAGRSFIQNAVRHGKGFKLTNTAQALVTAGRLDEFKAAFGDRFVRSLNTGGEFCIIARITSVSDHHQSALSAALKGSYNGLINSGSFDAAFATAMTETHGQTDVTVKVFQVGGQGGQLSFTGPEASSVIDRLKQLPADVHDHAGGLDCEMASYDTIPIPVPTEEEHQDRILVLQDCANQKNGFLRTISDLQLALEPNAGKLFKDLLPRDVLTQLLGQYRTALSALLAHAIQVSTGQMNPPRLFVANPAPPAVSFTKQPFADAEPVAIPNWGDLETADVGGTDAQGQHIPSAQELGLGLNVIQVQMPHGDEGTILSMIPPAGTPVTPPFTVTINVLRGGDN